MNLPEYGAFLSARSVSAGRFSACPISDDQGRGSDCDGIVWLYPFSGKKAEKSCDDFPQYRIDSGILPLSGAGGRADDGCVGDA